jgi:hypothetical protein
LNGSGQLFNIVAVAIENLAALREFLFVVYSTGREKLARRVTPRNAR